MLYSDTKDEQKLKKINESQNKKNILNVGGGRGFETAVSTLMTKPQSVLAKMISPGGVKPYSVDNVYTYLLNRNPHNFTNILDYLRKGGDLPWMPCPWITRTCAKSSWKLNSMN